MIVEDSESALLTKVVKAMLFFFATLPFLPVVLVVALAFWVYRQSAIFFVWMFVPELVSIVPPLDTLFVAKSTKRSNKRVMIPGVIVVEGNVDVDQVRDWFVSQIILMRKQDGPKKYPQLRQVQVPFLGFRWWKWDSTFHVNNHIRKSSLLSDLSLADIITRFANKPLPVNKPAWDITVINNYRGSTNVMSGDGGGGGEKTAIFYRISHTYCDGHSLLQMLISTLNSQPEMVNLANPYINSSSSSGAIQNPIAESQQQCSDDSVLATANTSPRVTTKAISISEKLIFLAYLCISFPYYMYTIIQKSRENSYPKTDAYSPTQGSDEVTQQLFFVMSEYFSASKIEDTARRLGVSLQTLIFSAISHGYSQSKAPNACQDDIKISANFPWLVNTQHYELCNNWAHGYYTVSPHQPSDIPSLMKIHERITAVNFSPSLASNYWFTWILSHLPVWVLKGISVDDNSQANMSCMSGPLTKVSVNEYIVDDFIVGSSIPLIETGLGVTVFNYGGKLRMLFTSNISGNQNSPVGTADVCHRISEGLTRLLEQQPVSSLENH